MSLQSTQRRVFGMDGLRLARPAKNVLRRSVAAILGIGVLQHVDQLPSSREVAIGGAGIVGFVNLLNFGVVIHSPLRLTRGARGASGL